MSAIFFISIPPLSQKLYCCIHSFFLACAFFIPPFMAKKNFPFLSLHYSFHLIFHHISFNVFCSIYNSFFLFYLSVSDFIISPPFNHPSIPSSFKSYLYITSCFNRQNIMLYSFSLPLSLMNPTLSVVHMRLVEVALSLCLTEC